MSRTNIEWADMSWPVVTGCTPCSIGCTNCYAARMAATRLKYHPRYEGLATISKGKAKWTGEVRLNHDVLEQPLHWKKPRQIFVCSMSDLFHEDVPFRFVDHVFHTVELARQHTFQILTKRPGRMLEYMASRSADFPLSNAWLGVSVENQAAADERIPLLLQTLAGVHYVSVEPMLGPVNMGQHLYYCTVADMSAQSITEENGGMFIQGASVDTWSEKPGLDWVICGGESGPGARPMHPDWARSLRDQCQAAEVPFFFKQWGEWIHLSQLTSEVRRYYCLSETDDQGLLRPDLLTLLFPGGKIVKRVGKKRAGHLLDSRVWQEFPGRK